MLHVPRALPVGIAYLMMSSVVFHYYRISNNLARC